MNRTPKAWLVKTEPGAYSLGDLEREGETTWEGVRNPLAQQHLRQMEAGDRVLVYHSGKEKAVVGMAEVAEEASLDPTDEAGIAVAEKLKFVESYRRPVELARIKAEPKLKEMPLVRMSRLSVMPVTPSHWKLICDLSLLT